MFGFVVKNVSAKLAYRVVLGAGIYLYENLEYLMTKDLEEPTDTNKDGEE